MKIFILISFLFTNNVKGQELFVYTEPASNMAAKSIGIRLNNTLMKQTLVNRYDYHFIPEVMVGVSKKIMIHGEAFFSNTTNKFTAEGGAVYVKYRFFSQDEVHSHFRMAAYAKSSINNGHIHQPAIDLNGHNTGYEVGTVATKLINKIAVSAIISVLHATDNLNDRKFYYGTKNRNAFGYSFSSGILVLPKEYTSYKQTNLNFMMELLGQTNIASGKSFLDLAPSIQFIFFSKMRADFGYRFALINGLERAAKQGFLLKLEYNLFNIFK